MRRLRPLAQDNFSAPGKRACAVHHSRCFAVILQDDRRYAAAEMGHPERVSMKTILSLIPPWVLGAIIMIVPAVVVLAVYRWLTRWLIRVAGRHSPFLQRLLERGQGPASAFVVIFALGAALPAARFPYPITIAIGRALLVAFILTVGWASAIAIDISITIYLRRFRTDVEDNLLARKHVTQMRILQRVATTLLAIVTIASALMTFESVRQYGVSLFASAGAAGIILGLAARPVLSNLLAGIQIAMTQPIRVEDQVVVEGESGWIETITSTYVVIRIWDLRRMIVPLTYFIEKPFQNWTYETSPQIGVVLLHVDYTVPVDRLRQKLNEILRDSKLWDGKVANLQVTDTPTDMVELRALVSAHNPSVTWDLRCEVREKLIAYLQSEYPHTLPRQRTEITRREISRALGHAAGDGQADPAKALEASVEADARQ
jgi:small-conductance mechanosensitive channel